MSRYKIRNNTNDIKYDLRNAGIGFVSGLAVAVGGGIKDAPYEGFDTVRFIRSPIIGSLSGLTIGRVLASEPIIIFFVTMAIERIITEGYKLGRSRMPGKFSYGEWGTPKCCSCNSDERY